jgi:hypothetical protein
MTDRSSNLRTIEYVSTATKNYADADLHALLDRALTFNLEVGVTGLLLFSNGVFVQTFEGHEEDVLAVFDRIRSDPSHSLTRVITDESIERRVYPDWAMMANFTALNPPVVAHLHSLMVSESALLSNAQRAALTRAIAFLQEGIAADWLKLS